MAFLAPLAKIALPYILPSVAKVLLKKFKIGSGVINGGFVLNPEIRTAKKTDINPYITAIFDKAYDDLKKQGLVRRKADFMKMKPILKKMLYQRLPIEVDEKKGGIVFLPGEG